MTTVAEFLKSSSDRNGFNRDKFEERKIPNDFSSICILPFFGDFRSCCILSSFLLNWYRNEVKSSKYFILASWPGLASMFPFVDEYWSLNDFSQLKRFYEGSDAFSNRSELNTIFTRNINEFFRDVVEIKDISSYYANGFTSAFFKRSKNPQRFLPFVSSSAVLGRDFLRDLSTYPGFKVFIHPSNFFSRWNNGKTQNSHIPKEFWIELVKHLIANNCTPIIWQNYLSYNLQEDFKDGCIFFVENEMSKVFSAMRSTGFVLDIFSNLSYFALIARCPYLRVDDRSRYFLQKDYEIEDLYPKFIKDNIFTFSTILTNGNPSNWKSDLFKALSFKIDKILPEIDRDMLPSTGESVEIVPYDDVRKMKLKKFGTRLLRVPNE